MATPRKTHAVSDDETDITVCKREPSENDLLMVNEPMYWLAINRPENITCATCYNKTFLYLSSMVEQSLFTDDKDCFLDAFERMETKGV